MKSSESNVDSAKIYVELLDEGTPTIRPTTGIYVAENVYRLLPTANYDPDDETWAFLPGSVVRCEWQDNPFCRRILVANVLAEMDSHEK